MIQSTRKERRCSEEQIWDEESLIRVSQTSVRKPDTFGPDLQPKPNLPDAAESPLPERKPNVDIA